MVALIHNQMAIIAHEIVNEAASNHALYDCYIKQSRCLCAATTDPANSALWHSEERGKALDPLMLQLDRKSTRLNSSHVEISYAVFCLKKKKKTNIIKTIEIKSKSI